MQRFYGLNLDGMGMDYTHTHAAACYACLPMSSATAARINPDFALLLSDLPVNVLIAAIGGGDGADDSPLDSIGSIPVDGMEDWLAQEWRDDGEVICG